ncbi:MAG: hypothetical protein QOE36_2909 [Gaiellaceae bacterium]|nr:hypothetical protein [Gaiellaceae bacterium]
MHTVIRAEEVELVPALPERSSGLTRALLLGGHTGTTHTGLMLVELDGGHVDEHLHSFESSFYVFSGEPVLYLDGRGVQLGPEACGAIPPGVPHAWRSAERARWVEAMSPRPRGPDQPADSFFLGPPSDADPCALDVHDPRNRHLFRLGEASSSRPFEGVTVRMLVDKRLDAELHTMFVVDLEPGAVVPAHDHPFEESYSMLEGEVGVVADGERETLRPGDVFWTGVGCIHSFSAASSAPVRWLETQAPAPPDRYAFRFAADWEALSA